MTKEVFEILSERYRKRISKLNREMLHVKNEFSKLTFEYALSRENEIFPGFRGKKVKITVPENSYRYVKNRDIIVWYDGIDVSREGKPRLIAFKSKKDGSKSKNRYMDVEIPDVFDVLRMDEIFPGNAKEC